MKYEVCLGDNTPTYPGAEVIESVHSFLSLLFPFSGITCSLTLARSLEVPKTTYHTMLIPTSSITSWRIGGVSAISVLGLSFAALFVVGVWLYKSVIVMSPQKTGNEPNDLYTWIPFFGHAFRFAKDKRSFFLWAQ